PLLQRSKEGPHAFHQKEDGGTTILVPVEYAQNSAGDWYSGAETLDVSDTDVITAAEFEWKQNFDNISITRRYELINSGDAAKIRFVASKVKNAEKSIKKKIYEAMWSDGSDAKSIVGIRKFVATSETYGGISQTDNSWWRAQVDSSTTTLTLSALQT